MTVIANAGLVLKDSQGNKGIVKSFTDNDIDKISSAITDVGQVVDPATHMPIEATKTSAGVVQLATAQDITNGTAGKVVDAQELNNFAQTLPAANGVTDVSSGDNSNQLVVSRIGGSKTLTIDNVEHADNADEATHASQADTATAANSVAWDNVSGKPNTFAPATHNHDDRYYTESEIDTKLSGKSDTTHNHNSAYLGISAKAESAKSADSVAWANVSGKPSSYTPSSHNHDDRYYTESEIDTKLGGKANSSHTHDDRYYTESEIDTKLGGKANTSGALFTVNGLAKPGWSKIGTGEGGSCIQVKTTDNTYPSICFHRSGHSHCVLAESSGQLGTMQEGNGTFNHLITSANIGSQSVNYANSAGSVAWNNVSGKPSTYTPSSHTHDDRYYTESEINTKLSALLLQIYPVGAIYISANSTNPGTLFGGTWKALDQGRVLIGANSTYKAGTTGGEFTHTITTGEMPSHTHTGTTGNESAGHTHSGTTGNQSAGHTHTWSGTTSSNGSHEHTASSNSTGSHNHQISGGKFFTLRSSNYNETTSGFSEGNMWANTPKGAADNTTSNGSHSHTITVNSNGAHTHTVSGTTGGISANHNHSFTTGGISAHHNHGFTTGASGSGSAMNNMQPYLAVYMWQRTA